ncbi:phage tail spike protein [Metabacillus sp. HB246100]
MSDLLLFDNNDDLLAVLSNEPDQNEDEEHAACPFSNAPFKEELNRGSTFEFNVPANHADSVYVKEENQVAFMDKDGYFRLFIIRETDSVDGENGPEIKAYCEPSFMETDDDPIEDIRPYDTTAEDALQRATVNSRWKAGVVAPLGIRSTNFYYISVKKAIEQILNTWGGELRDRIEIKDNKIVGRYIDILSRRGADTGKRWEIDKDIIAISRNKKSYVKTALYGRGKSLETDDGGYTRKITFADVEWSVANGDPVDKPLGQEWVGDPQALAHFGYKNSDGSYRHRYGFYENGNIEDPEELLLDTWNTLQIQSKQFANYTIDGLLLENIDGYEFEKVSLGDTNIAIDRNFAESIEVELRIISYEYDVANPHDVGKVEMGQFIELYDEEREIEAIKAKINDKEGIWESGGGPIDDSDFPDIIPETPTLTASGLFQTVLVDWTFQRESYVAEYELYAARIDFFEPNPTTLIYRGKSSGYTHSVGTNELWYYTVRAVNTHGNASEFSNYVEAQTARIVSDEIMFGAITKDLLADLAVDASKLADLAVTTDKLNSGAVTNGKLGALAVDASKLANGSVIEGKLGSGAVTNGKLADLVVDASKLASGSVIEGKLGSGAVTNGKLANLVVDASKLANSAVTTTKIANLAVGAAAIQDLAVTNSKIANLGVTSAKIDDASITSAKIVDLAVGNAAIANGAITEAKIAYLAVGNAAIANGAIKEAKIEDLAVTTAKIDNVAITSAKIASLAVGTGAIQNLAVTNGKIGSLAVDTAQIASSAITNAKIANLAVDSAKIANLAITTAKIADAAITNAKIDKLDAGKITTGTLKAIDIEGVRITGSTINGGTFTTTGSSTGTVSITGGYAYTKITGNKAGSTNTFERKTTLGYGELRSEEIVYNSSGTQIGKSSMIYGPTFMTAYQDDDVFTFYGSGSTDWSFWNSNIILRREIIGGELGQEETGLKLYQDNTGNGFIEAPYQDLEVRAKRDVVLKSNGSGDVQIHGNGGSNLSIVGNNHAYIEFYPKTDSTSSRYAYLGFSTSNTNDFTLDAQRGKLILSSGVSTIYTDDQLNIPFSYNATTGYASNVYINSYGRLYRSTSSIKYKKDIEDLWESEYRKILQLRPVWYRSNEQTDEARLDWSHVGLIAEEVHEIEPRLVHYKEDFKTIEQEDGSIEKIPLSHDELEPEGIQYDRLAVYMLPVVQRHEERIQELERKLAELSH